MTMRADCLAADAEKTAIAAHRWAREANDWYVEEPWCSARLFAEEYFAGTILDPCCGRGNIIRAARAAGHAVLARDIVDRGCDDPNFVVGDFFDFETTVDNIVCNPPFADVERFARHALQIARHKVAMIFPTARLNAAHKWLAGTSLESIWLLTPRPSMPPGHIIIRGGKIGGGKQDFCWLIWRNGYRGSPFVRWLKRG